MNFKTINFRDFNTYTYFVQEHYDPKFTETDIFEMLEFLN